MIYTWMFDHWREERDFFNRKDWFFDEKWFDFDEDLMGDSEKHIYLNPEKDNLEHRDWVKIDSNKKKTKEQLRDIIS